jgi:hypothetical protein
MLLPAVSLDQKSISMGQESIASPSAPFHPLCFGSLANVGFVGMVHKFKAVLGIDRALCRGSSGEPEMALEHAILCCTAL